MSSQYLSDEAFLWHMHAKGTGSNQARFVQRCDSFLQVWSGIQLHDKHDSNLYLSSNALLRSPPTQKKKCIQYLSPNPMKQYRKALVKAVLRHCIASIPILGQMIITRTSVIDAIFLRHLTLHHSNISVSHMTPWLQGGEATLFSIDVREQTHYPQSHTCMNAQSELRGVGGGTWLWLGLRNWHGIIPSFAKARGVRRNNSTKTPKTTIKHICWARERERMEWKTERER